MTEQFQADVHLYLIECRYEVYCQGMETTSGYFLVPAKSFNSACEKLKRSVKSATDFKNRTIGVPEPILEADL